MDIMVGLWSRDHATFLSENQGTRLYWLEQAVRTTQDKRRELAAKFTEVAGAVRTIFAAPEYLFSAERISETNARSLSDASRAALKSLLKSCRQSMRDPGDTKSVGFIETVGEKMLGGESLKLYRIRCTPKARAAVAT